MDRKITRKDARAMYTHIIRASFCELEHAGISQRDRVGYNSGRDGWNWDLIPVPGVSGVAVCAGYNPALGAWLPDGLRAKFRDLAHVANGYFNHTHSREESERARTMATDMLKAYAETL